MSAVPASERRVRHLRVLLVSLGVLVVGLAVFLFAVRMEATATATGTVMARGQVEIRSPSTGIIDLMQHVPGSEVRPGEGLALVGQQSAVIAAPKGASLWLVATVDVAHGQAVEAGQKLMTLVPLDPATRQPLGWLARLEVREEHAIEVEPGKRLRVWSQLYNERVHGSFGAVVERVEPMARRGEDGHRYYIVLAALEDPPGPLLLGSGVKAEVLLGKKRVWRIILEH